MSEKEQARLTVLYATPADNMTPTKQRERDRLHAKWITYLDNLIDRINQKKP